MDLQEQFCLEPAVLCGDAQRGLDFGRGGQRNKGDPTISTYLGYKHDFKSIDFPLTYWVYYLSSLMGPYFSFI